jgi:hypothetical protein
MGQHTKLAQDFGSADIRGVTWGFLVPLRRVLLVFLAAISSGHAEDVQPSLQVWLNPGFLSLHFDRSKDLRGDNWGVGAEVVFTPHHTVMAGNFINSNDERSNYASYQWRPLHWRPSDIAVSAGIGLGVVDGYPYHNGGWFAMLFPLLAVEGKRIGANLTVVPTIEDKVHGAIVIQIKLRVW